MRFSVLTVLLGVLCSETYGRSEARYRRGFIIVIYYNDLGDFW